MTRRLLSLLTALSLLLCVAVCVLWVRSYWASDWVQRHAVRWIDMRLSFSDWSVSAGRGTLVVRKTHWLGAIDPSERTGSDTTEWSYIRSLPHNPMPDDRLNPLKSLGLYVGQEVDPSRPLVQSAVASQFRWRPRRSRCCLAFGCTAENVATRLVTACIADTTSAPRRGDARSVGRR